MRRGCELPARRKCDITSHNHVVENKCSVCKGCKLPVRPKSDITLCCIILYFLIPLYVPVEAALGDATGSTLQALDSVREALGAAMRSRLQALDVKRERQGGHAYATPTITTQIVSRASPTVQGPYLPPGCAYRGLRPCRRCPSACPLSIRASGPLRPTSSSG